MALCLKQVFNKDRTFRPRKKFEPGTQRFELYKKAQASLKSGVDLKTVVQLPAGENLNDWIAVNTVDFFNRINLIYGTICEYCTERSCPIMSGGLKYEYRWQDEHKYKKPTKVTAPQYMNLLMDWIEALINNEDNFPTRVGSFKADCFNVQIWVPDPDHKFEEKWMKNHTNPVFSKNRKGMYDLQKDDWKPLRKQWPNFFIMWSQK